MFCKFCGKAIDKETMKCVACGKAVGPLEGGVGFWDLAGESAAPAANAGKQAQSAAKSGAKTKILAGALAVLSTAALAGNAFLLNNVSDLKGNNQLFEEQVQALLAEKEQAEAQKAEEALLNAQKAQPSLILSGPQVLTEQASQEAVQLVLQAQGKDLDFQWQKKDSTEDAWEDVDPDVFLQQVEELTDSSKVTLSWDPSAQELDGEYRCIISNDSGVYEESPAIILMALKEQPAEDGEALTPEEPLKENVHTGAF